MVPRVALVSLVLLCVAAGCGSPTAPTSTPLPASGGSSGAPLPGSGAPGSEPPGSIDVVAASMIEFKDSFSQEWTYAPQVRVAETSGKGGIRITGIELTIPGYALSVCDTTQYVGAGQSRELFQGSYGEYPVTWGATGHRLLGDVLFAVRFADGLGQTGTLTVHAPIVPGDLPASSGPDPGRWLCRPPG